MKVALLKRGYGWIRSSISPFLILLFFFSFPAKSEEPLLLAELLKKAREVRLSDDRYWHVLLHYKPVQSGYKSLIDDPRFFLAPDGKENPAAELEATLTSLLKSDNKNDAHPRCKFIARYEWLKEKLAFDDTFFSGIACHDFNTAEKTVQPQSAVLVFPAFFMNNPASMFGHTLLRLDSRSQSKLLAFAANYAAFPDSMGLLYPIKGTFGFYKGYFTLFPYYDRVKMYNDTEQRDMWEYRLNLSESEVRKILLHLWELKDIYSYYYFFDENCSYNLLFLLEAARPSLHLTDFPRPWVIPTDSVRMVEENNLVEKIDFRPSQATRIRYLASLLDDHAQTNALRIATHSLEPGQLSSLNSGLKIRTLDLAIEDIQYKYNTHQLTKEDYLRVFLSTLNERSKMGNPGSNLDKIPAPEPPEAGHQSGRLSSGLGVKEKVSFFEIDYRGAYHSLVDPDNGFAEGLQIIFGETAIRSYSDGRIKLDHIDLINIMSISPRDLFFRPFSYMFTTGLKEQLSPDGNDKLVYQISPGAGVSFENRWLGLYYGLAEINFGINGDYKDYTILGGGIKAGTIKKITDSWKMNLSVEKLFYPFRESFQESKASAIQTFRLSQSHSLNLALLWDEVLSHARTEVKLNWNYYF